VVIYHTFKWYSERHNGVTAQTAFAEASAVEGRNGVNSPTVLQSYVIKISISQITKQLSIILNICIISLYLHDIIIN